MSDDTQEVITARETSEKMLQDDEEEYFATYGDAIHPAVLHFLDGAKTGKPLVWSATTDASTLTKIAKMHTDLQGENTLSIDTLTLSTSDPLVGSITNRTTNQEVPVKLTNLSLNFPCTFWAEEDKVGVVLVDGLGISVHLPHWKPTQWKILVEALNERNLGAGLSNPFPPTETQQQKSFLPVEQRDRYPQRLEPDTETVYEALSRAPRGISKEGDIGFWLLNTDRNHLSYASRNHKGYTALLVPSEGEEVDFLEVLLKSGSLQAARALNYIYGVLLGDGTNIPDTPKARTSLDDISENVWGVRRVTNKVKIERRAEVWKWLQMFRAMKIVGQRSGWRDFKTKEPAPYIHANILVVSDEEYDDLYGENPPRSVLIAILSEFAVMLGRKFGCYLEGAEKMKEIPSGKPSGALAHALYISLNSHWKRNKNLDRNPTRRELIDRNDMEGGKSFLDYLYSETKGESDRALGYWMEALKRLAQEGIIDHSSKELKFDKFYFVKAGEWRDKWLDENVDIHPADFIRKQLARVANQEQIEKGRSMKKHSPKKAKSEEYSPL